MNINNFIYGDLGNIADHLHSERSSLSDTEILALLTNICRTVSVIESKQRKMIADLGDLLPQK